MQQATQKALKRSGRLTAAGLLSADFLGIIVLIATVFLGADVSLSQSNPSQIYLPFSDRIIGRAVKQAFFYDTRIRMPIRVVVHKGEVTLAGIVYSEEEKRAAGEAAEQTTGVVGVKNMLEVQRVERLTDADLAERVKAALSQNPYSDPAQLHVSVTNGTVYLSGTVDSYFERVRAEYAVYPVRGITMIVNEIRILSEEVWKHDEVMKRNIEQELRKYPSIDGEPLHVSVRNGVVTLGGTVHSLEERTHAIESAYESGAKSVRSHLTVKYTYDPSNQ